MLLFIDRFMKPMHVKIPFLKLCDQMRHDKSKCRARKMHVFWSFFFFIFLQIQLRRPPTVKSPRAFFSHSLRFYYFCLKLHFFAFHRFIEATCSPDLHSINISRFPRIAELKQQTKKRTKKLMHKNAFVNRENLGYLFISLSIWCSLNVNFDFLCA